MIWKEDKRNRKRDATDGDKGKVRPEAIYKLSTVSVGHVDMTIAACCPM